MKKEIMIAASFLVMLFILLLCMENYAGINAVTVNARYVLLTPMGNTEFRKLVAEGIHSADQEYGTDTQFIACADNFKMAEQIDKAVLCAVDGILILGYDYSEEVKAAVIKAREEGIRVVLLDHKLADIPYDYFVGIDNQKAGAMAADYLFNAIHAYEDSVVITNKLAIENQQLRYSGFSSEWKKQTGGNGVYVLEGNGDYMQLKWEVTQLLKKYPDLRVFFCAEATSSVYLKDILNSLKIEDTCVMGFDLLEETLRHVEDGSYQYVIGQDAPEIGYTAISWLWKGSTEGSTGANGKETMLPAFLVDSTNAAKYYIGNLEGQKWLTE